MKDILKASRGRRRIVLGIAWGLLAVCIAAIGWLIWYDNTRPPPSEDPPEPEAKQIQLDVPYLNQNEKYPTGCESVSAVMALQYAGVSITVEEFIDQYLEQGAAPRPAGDGQWYGCDPRVAFPGSPYTNGGWGCYAPVIARGMQKVVEGKPYTVEECEGRSLEQLCSDYIDAGVPVLIWGSQYMAPVREDITFLIPDTGEEFQWLTPMHCLLLTGYDEKYYYFNDPMTEKNQRYTKAAAEAAYTSMGKQAVVLTQ